MFKQSFKSFCKEFYSLIPATESLIYFNIVQADWCLKYLLHCFTVYKRTVMTCILSFQGV